MDPRLEHELKLSDLANRESLANLASRLAAFEGVAVAFTDPGGAPLVRSGRAWSCGIAGCAACSGPWPRFPDSKDKVQLLPCGGGAEYQRTRIDNQFEVVGYAVIGPYRAADEAAGGAVAPPRLPRPRARRVVELACTVLEEIVFANYQGYLVSKLHLQNQSDRAGELAGKDAELQDFEETLRQSRPLRDLF